MRFIQAISNVAGEKLRSAGCWARSKILRSRRSKKIEETNSAIVIGAPTDVRREEYTLETDAAGNLGLVVKTHDETKLGSLSNDPDLAELLGGGENDIQQT